MDDCCKPEKKSSPLKGVDCNVDSCHYNDACGKCTAAKINVSPGGVQKTNKPDCDTYTKR